MSGHRQAAIALYSLHASDQGAILAELPAKDQDILRALLAELAELGFDKAANSGAIAPATRTGAASSEGASADQLRALRRATPAAMFSILGREPASLLAFFLSLEYWPWAPEFLELLAPARRELVRSASEAGFPAAPARARYLLEAAAAALGDTPGVAAAAGPNWFASTLSRLTPWTR